MFKKKRIITSLNFVYIVKLILIPLSCAFQTLHFTAMLIMLNKI